jgi:CheY-like chemotaxis protein
LELQTDRNKDWLGRGTILVVDDEEAVRAVSELILPTIGFTSLVAADGFEACKLLHKHCEEVVAVMLDLTMPKMDGVKTVQELRKIKPGVKVLLMSGYDEDEAVNRFTNEGFDCFLQKPFIRNQLRDKLRFVLEGK